MSAAPQMLMADGAATLALHEDGVMHLTMNRPASSNSVDAQSMPVLLDAIRMVQQRREARALLLTGAGKNFCAGGDVKSFRDQGADLPQYIRVATAQLAQITQGLMRLHVPVIAAVQGFAAGGGGMGLVCAADLVVAGESARFMTGATRVAMVPDAGVTATLARLVGFRRAMEMVLLNSVITAEDALAIGLINRVVPDDRIEAEAMDIAREIARGAPLAMGMAKHLLWSGQVLPPEAAMPEENAAQVRLCGTADALEGLDAVIARRDPVFEGR
ncbi:enoyl-CoA hydratase/isomerase family protein [Erythrobacter sp. HI0063]|uniref:enoyl-CoA hydratase/isomerase family protein n=1 Tax=Erythrobacter sp. HI0063 TaxID=1822240 RepID=UPI0009EDE0D6|nr:enoyl-CoA hydratase-related protein [Erythrobacter sp. HI0063]